MFFRVLGAMMAADAIDRHMREQQARRFNELYGSRPRESQGARPQGGAGQTDTAAGRNGEGSGRPT